MARASRRRAQKHVAIRHAVAVDKLVDGGLVIGDIVEHQGPAIVTGSPGLCYLGMRTETERGKHQYIWFHIFFLIRVYLELRNAIILAPTNRATIINTIRAEHGTSTTVDTNRPPTDATSENATAPVITGW